MSENLATTLAWKINRQDAKIAKEVLGAEAPLSCQILPQGAQGITLAARKAEPHSCVSWLNLSSTVEHKPLHPWAGLAIRG